MIRAEVSAVFLGSHAGVSSSTYALAKLFRQDVDFLEFDVRLWHATKAPDGLAVLEERLMIREKKNGFNLSVYDASSHSIVRYSVNLEKDDLPALGNIVGESIIVGYEAPFGLPQGISSLVMMVDADGKNQPMILRLDKKSDYGKVTVEAAPGAPPAHQATTQFKPDYALMEGFRDAPILPKEFSEIFGRSIQGIGAFVNQGGFVSAPLEQLVIASDKNGILTDKLFEKLLVMGRRIHDQQAELVSVAAGGVNRLANPDYSDVSRKKLAELLGTAEGNVAVWVSNNASYFSDGHINLRDLVGFCLYISSVRGEKIYFDRLDKLKVRVGRILRYDVQISRTAAAEPAAKLQPPAVTATNPAPMPPSSYSNVRPT